MKKHKLYFSTISVILQFVRRLIPQKVIDIIYRSRFLSKLIRNHLNKAVPSGLTEVCIGKGILRGKRLKLDLKKEKYYWLSTYEPEVIQAINDFVKPGMIVYDLGGNIGYISLIFAEVVGNKGKVFTFEPLPANIERIQEHIRLNSLEQIIQIIPKAVSDQKATQTFLVHDLNAMGKLSDSSRDETYTNKINVTTISLDEFIYSEGNPVPQLIKIDIEGGAVKAFPGMNRMLKEHRPIVLMEMHGPEEAETAWKYLEQYGYKICGLKKNYPVIQSLKSFDRKNYILAIAS